LISSSLRNYRGKVNPAGAELVERHWLLARASQPLEHPQLLGFTERHLRRLWTLSLPASFAPFQVLIAAVTTLPRASLPPQTPIRSLYFL
jgi:hypothetical protein